MKNISKLVSILVFYIPISTKTFALAFYYSYHHSPSSPSSPSIRTDNIMSKSYMYSISKHMLHRSYTKKMEFFARRSFLDARARLNTKHFFSTIPSEEDTSTLPTNHIPPLSQNIYRSNTKKDNGVISSILQESEWREQAQRHAERIYTILSPGMLPMETFTNANRKIKQQQQRQHLSYAEENNPNLSISSLPWRGLDPYHPIYNFLIEYYGIRGAKGCRKLGRWSPPLTCSHDNDDDDEFENIPAPDNNRVLLEGASKQNDFGGSDGILHSRGAFPYHNIASSSAASESELINSSNSHTSGYIYNPCLYFSSKATAATSSTDTKNKAAIPYLWHYTILHQTYTNPQPITHCFGLHEWAMVYHPPNSPYPPPPSAKYQAHLPRRVSQSVINEMVERKGVACTHYDAIRFFAKDALPLLQTINHDSHSDDDGDKSNNERNHHVPPPPSSSSQTELPIQRSDQAIMEQSACVHANMDLFKLSLKLSPFVSSTIIGDALDLALECRRLDVAASPYDASEYGVIPVQIETSEGRSIYKERQIDLLHKGQKVRKKLMKAYEDFLIVSFGDDMKNSIDSIRKGKI